MFETFWNALTDWYEFDTWTVIVAALASMSCALPGNFLLLRRQSMMGDALSHSVLLGIVLAFLSAQFFKAQGWISHHDVITWAHTFYFIGAIFIGLLCALLTEWVQKLGQVESSTSLGVVFTSLFALGLVLLRVSADSVHIDPDCVLYGNVETAFFDTWRDTSIPKAAIMNGLVLVLNLGLLCLFYKELKLSTFDPEMANALGFPARAIHYGLMAMTALTLIVAFETVGSILVIAMLIAPAASAFLLTNKLNRMLMLSLLIAAAASAIGHASAIALPEVLFGQLGYPKVKSVSTAGMMAVSCLFFFCLSALFAPQFGFFSKLLAQWKLTQRIQGEDLLGLLYRLEESEISSTEKNKVFQTARQERRFLNWFSLRFLLKKKQIRLSASETGYDLTQAGRAIAQRLVRSHRLWESYVAKHFAVAEDQYHESAHRVEHYVDADARSEMAKELDQPQDDPHGKTIPEER